MRSARLGLSQAPRDRLEVDLRCRRLLRVPMETPPAPLPVSVLYPRARHLSPRLRVFIDWMVVRSGPDPAGG